MTISRRQVLSGTIAAALGGVSHSCPGIAVAQQIVMAEWWETVEIEHQDRKNRMRRIADKFLLQPPPIFLDYRIPRTRLPATFPVEMPVLRVIFPDRSFFDTAETAMLPRGQEILGLIAENLRGEPPDVTMFIAGHTDSRGSDAYNDNLSVARADAVGRELISYGTGDTLVWRVGFGESVPIASNGSSDGQALNRRVEFLFAGRLEPVVTWLARQLDLPCFSTSDNACRTVAPTHPITAVELTPQRRDLPDAPRREVHIDLRTQMYEIPAPTR